VGFGGRRQSSVSGTSRMNREVHVRFCERLGVKFPGPTRPWKMMVTGETYTANSAPVALAASAAQRSAKHGEHLNGNRVEPMARIAR